MSHLNTTIPPAMRLTLLGATYRIDQTLPMPSENDANQQRLVVAQTDADDLLIIVSKENGVWHVGFDLEEGQEVSVRADTGYRDVLSLVPQAHDISVTFAAPVPDKAPH
jgi:hypothetical protein